MWIDKLDVLLANNTKLLLSVIESLRFFINDCMKLDALMVRNIRAG